MSELIFRPEPTEQRPCPYCDAGVENLTVMPSDDRKQMQVVCVNCESRGPARPTTGDAMRAWQFRASDRYPRQLAENQYSVLFAGEAYMLDKEQMQEWMVVERTKIVDDRFDQKVRLLVSWGLRVRSKYVDSQMTL